MASMQCFLIKRPVQGALTGWRAARQSIFSGKSESHALSQLAVMNQCSTLLGTKAMTGCTTAVAAALPASGSGVHSPKLKAHSAVNLLIWKLPLPLLRVVQDGLDAVFFVVVGHSQLLLALPGLSTFPRLRHGSISSKTT